jgi:4-hydroxybenzoate polyprenyltransferase
LRLKKNNLKSVMSAKKNNFWLSRLDYLFVLRPILFYPGWSTMLAGYYIHTKSEWFPDFTQDDTGIIRIILLIAGFAMIMGSSFVLNQLKDIESDKKNRKLFFIADGILSVKTAKSEVLLLTILALLIGFSLKIEVGILFVIFFLVTGVFYNFPPARMKDRPWGSLFANALMGWLAFSIGWSARQPVEFQLLIDSLPYFCFNTALYLFTLLPDKEGDDSSRKKTLAVAYGLKKMVNWAFILYAAGLLISMQLGDYQALLFYLLSIPFFIRTVIHAGISDTIRATKYGILFFALSICIRWPIYFLLMIIGFFGSKYYFKKRFAFDYPNFSGK